jgi:ABC-type antimicrobial peptide transport system permease subunit
VTQWWLELAHPPPGLPGGMSATTRAGLAAALLGNPVSATPQQVLLVIALAGAALALAGFGVSVTATISERRLESALLSALGVSRAAQVRQLCLEELLLSGLAAVAGLALGALAALLLVPAVTLTPGATVPVPPAQTELAWAQVIPLALVVAALPVLAAALSLARRPDPAAQLRAVEPG